MLKLGATSIEKSLKSSASGRTFLDPSPPYSKKGPTDENVGISYLIVIVKFGFFKISTPLPYFGEKPNFTNFINWGGPLALLYILYPRIYSKEISFDLCNVYMLTH